MERILVVVDDTDAHRSLLAEASEVAAATGADIVLFSWMSPSEAEEGTDAIESVERMENTSYSDPDPVGIVRSFATEFGDAVFAEAGVEGVDRETAAVVAEERDLADEIVNAAFANDCDHIYVVGKKRSPTGKAIFGDLAQQVVLNFEGPVTVLAE